MFTLAASFDPPSFQQWLLIGLLGAALLVVAVQSRRGRSGRGPSARKPSAIARGEAHADEPSQQVQKDFEQLLAELENLSERITQQVEEEFGRLQGLMTEADRRISALRVLIEASRQMREMPRPNDAGAIAPRGFSEAPFGLSEPGHGLSALPRGVSEMASAPRLSYPPQPGPGASQGERRFESVAPVAPPNPMPAIASHSVPLDGGLESDPRFAQIYHLADAGFDPRDIAQKLGESVGTVELVLNLRSPPSDLSAK